MNGGDKEVCGARGKSEAKQGPLWAIEGSVEREVRRGKMGPCGEIHRGDMGSVGRMWYSSWVGWEPGEKN